MSAEPGRRRPARLLRNTAFLLSFGWRHARGYLVFSFCFAAFQRVVVFFQHTYSIKLIIDCIQYGRPFSTVLAYMLVVCVFVAFAIAGLAYIDLVVRPRCRERIHLAMRRELHARAASLDLACYDEPGFFNDFVWVVNEAPDEFDRTMDRCYNFIAAITTIVVAGGFLALTDPAGLLFVGVSMGATLGIQTLLGRTRFALDAEANPLKRRMSYVARVYHTADHAKELRLTGAGSLLGEEFSRASHALEAVIRKHSRRRVVLGFLDDFVFSRLFLDGLYVAWLVWQVMVLGRLGYGDLVALLSSTANMKDRLQSISRLIGESSASSLFVDKIRSFMALEPRIRPPGPARPVPPAPWTLELRDVAFRYPGTDRPVLHEINLVLRPGETVALVGHNGAGKTSLVKLLMRLYEPDTGAIFLNGIDIREFDPVEYRLSLGVVFQDFQLFAASVGENVAMDVLPPDDPRRGRVAEGLAHSGLGSRLSGLAQGLDTPLTREFEPTGTSLSGGEGQKLALARILSRAPALSILDEPSSALDPVSEYQLNETMRTAMHGATVVYISHRLSTTRMADRICFLEKGSVKEEGSHDELMGLGGGYARMFTIQAERYRPFLDGTP